MKLNKKKINKWMGFQRLTWQDMADMGGLKSRQAAFQKLKSPKNAEWFGKILKVDPKELIIFD